MIEANAEKPKKRVTEVLNGLTGVVFNLGMTSNDL